MADPIEIVLEFLQRNQFAKAEAAFKAELLTRSERSCADLLSETVLGWDLQLRSTAWNNLDGRVLDSSRSGNNANAQTANVDSERRLHASDNTIPRASDSERKEFVKKISTGRATSPTEKQLYVEYESCQSKSQEPLPLVSQDYAFLSSKTPSESLGRIYNRAGQVNSPTDNCDSTMQRFSWRCLSNGAHCPSSASSTVTYLQPFLSKHGQKDPGEPESAQVDFQSVWPKQTGSDFDSALRLEDADQVLQKCEVQRSGLENDELIGPQSTFDMGVCHVSSNSVKRQESRSSQEELEMGDLKFFAPKTLSDSEKIKLCEAECGAFQHHNGFLPRSIREGPFKETILKTSFPVSVTKFSHKNDNQRSTIPDYIDFGNEKDAAAYSWNGNELQKFEAKDPISSYRAAGNALFFNSQELIANRQSVEETLPRLPPVRIHSHDKNMDILKDGGCAIELENATRNIALATFKSTSEEGVGWGMLENGSVGQDMSTLGLKRAASRPSVSQGIVEDLSDPLSGFTTAVDGQSEQWYPDVYCDSDTWEDDDDPGYHRQPIEDEEWFLSNEIDYPSDDERSRQHTDKTLLSGVRKSKKLDEDDGCCVEEESYFSGEEYYRQQLTRKEIHRLQMSKSIEQINRLKDACSTVFLSRNDDDALNLSRCNDEGNVYDDNLYGSSRGNNDDLNLSRGNDDGNDYDGHLCNSAETNLLASQPVWKGFMYQADQLGQSDLISSGDRPDELGGDNVDDENHGSVRSGLLISSDAADIGSEVRDSLIEGSSDGDAESLRYQALSAYGSAFGNFKPQDFLGAKEGRHLEVKSAPLCHLDDGENHDAILQCYSEEWSHVKEPGQRDSTRGSNLGKDQSKRRHSSVCNNKAGQGNGGFVFEGFSFPSPSSTCDVTASRTGSGKSLWSNIESTAHGEETDGLGRGLVGPDDTLAAWKRKSNNSSPGMGSSEDNLPKSTLLNCLSGSPHSTDEYVSIEAGEDSDVGGLNGSSLPKANESLAQDDEEEVAQDELRTLGADENQYEIFDLRIIHRKNRTGFEEDKEFPIMINSVIAGRYHVTEYLGSAAFSKAIQAHDLQTGLDVCMKVIKNNKDFFDQSLDEIKLLKFVNKHDPADKYHILRLYDYFYHREHLFIVCELLRANLYEFHKFNRESGGEVYFTMPRLQSITVQCLEALDFLHRLGIIHCDLKPENILVKSYSRCEIKIIDLGSSCFQTDQLCSYVQSRSYRAPEVILGLPYDQKIDIWSLGCILAELCTGNVLFQNDSLATLLARVVGILGPLDAEILAKGRDTYKYFTKNHMLYERNQETDQLEYLIPKKTSLSHRLPMGDQGFVEFAGFLLQSNPTKRPTASEALQHPWLSYPYEPISS